MVIENRHGLHVAGPEDLPTFNRLQDLIEAGKAKLADLKNAAHSEKINQLEYLELVLELAEKNESELAAAKATIEDLENKRHVDPLTGLSNNPEPVLDKLIGELNFSDENRQSTLSAIVVAYIDINRLKFLNDTYGHAFGDQALVAFADRLKTVIKEGTDFIFRPHSHGDEFVVIFSIKNDRVVSDEALKRLFQRLQKKVNNDFSIKIGDDHADFQLSASMDYVVLRKGESKTAIELQHEADLRMLAKKKGF